VWTTRIESGIVVRESLVSDMFGQVGFRVVHEDRGGKGCASGV